MNIFGVLSTIFVVLKIVGVISWSWWVVFLPEIIGFAFHILMRIAKEIYKGIMDKPEQF